MNSYKILAVDGGGIRGVLPAEFLARIQSAIDRPIGAFFNLFAGTSTGAIIALALARGVSISKVTELYCSKGKRVFDKRWYRGPRSLFASKYRNDLLREELELVFRNSLLEDCEHDVCIPSVDLDTGQAVVFTKETHPKSRVVDVAMASAAAPTYFPAYSPLDSGQGLFADGGLWANNPVPAALGHAARHKLLPQAWVLSLGTGMPIKRAPIGRSYSGLYSWGSYLIDAASFAQSSGADRLAQDLLGGRYLRVNVVLNDEESQLDALNAVQRLRQLASAGYASQSTMAKIAHHFFGGRDLAS